MVKKIVFVQVIMAKLHIALSTGMTPLTKVILTTSECVFCDWL